VIGANEFRTENFSESPWMLSAPVRVNRSVAGRIDVGYLEKMPESDEGPFMKEERLLINAIAERLGRIAERKKAELDLASAMTMLKEAQHLAHIGTWDWLVEGDVVTWSEELYNFNGRDSSLPAPSFAEQSRLFTPTSWERLSSAVKGALTTGEPYNLELELVRPDGSIRWTNGIGGVKRDEKGKVIGLHGILQDITERRRVEEALRKANKKLNLLGSVTRHDAINQLSVVFAWLEIAKEVAARDEPVHEHLARVGEAAKMIRRQLEFTADYQEIGVKRPEWMDLADAVNRGVEGLRKGKMSLNIDVAGVQVFADTMLEKVFYNLVENALRHGEKVKSISISARETKEGLTIVCEDDGIGIPADDKEKVFLRGFGKNTGFGLYMVREVLDITGIRVRETGVPGKGARFEMLVPAGNYRRGHPGQ
jgi:PAS domain-containing protein/two-component sensor histidine kinase